MSLPMQSRLQFEGGLREVHLLRKNLHACTCHTLGTLDMGDTGEDVPNRHSSVSRPSFAILPQVFGETRLELVFSRQIFRRNTVGVKTD